MPATNQVSVFRTIRRMLLVAIGAVVIGAGGAHEYLRIREIERASIANATFTGEVLATQFRPDQPVSREQLQQICERIAEHPLMLGLVVWNQTGEQAAIAGHRSDIKTLLDAPSPAAKENGPAVRTLEIPVEHGQGSIRVRRVDVVLGKHLRSERPAHLALLILTPQSGWLSEADVWWYRGSITLLALLGVVFSSWWMHRQVVTPLALLARAAKEGRLGDARVSPTVRRDEIGLLARSLLELVGEMTNWRDRANRIERSLDSRVAEQTKTIHRDLKKTQREAWKDPLTGVRNRRLLDEKFEEIFTAQRRQGMDMALVMLDLDHFKTLNDTLGHRAGDEILSFVGDLLRQCLRADDTAIRYGGDEFVLILPNASAQQALEVVQRIMSLFAQRAKVLNCKPVPAMSIGIASLFNDEPNTPKEMLELADRALYQAKQAGRNRACVSHSLERLAPAEK